MMRARSIIFFLVLFLIGTSGYPQTKPGQTKSGQTKKTTTQKGGQTTSPKYGQQSTAKQGSSKTSAGKTQNGKQGTKAEDKNAPKPGALPADKIDPLREQANQLVKFFESTLNFLADKRNTVQDKQVIINESYLKFFWDQEVQVEDDLDENRLVPLYKDVQAYLTDVDFFFKRAIFTYTVQDISVMTNELGNTFFKVTCNRNISGMNLNGDSINTNRVRYIEINYDESKQQLKIVSVYTTKLNEKDDMRNWWNGLSQGWQQKLGKDLQIGSGLTLASVVSYNDTLAQIGDQKTPIDQNAFYTALTQIMGLKKLDLSGDKIIADLSPLSKLSSIRELYMKNTPVSDLMPLRNLNSLEVLDISNTPVSSLDPIHYCTHIRELYFKGSQITDLSQAVNFPSLEILDVSRTSVASLDPVRDHTGIRDLRCAYSRVTDLSPIALLTNIELLNVSNTVVGSLDPLKNMNKLRILLADSTGISSLAPVENLPVLQRIYCDYTKLPKPDAIEFMLKHPGTFLVFESPELSRWWSGMPADWQNLLSHFTELSSPPTKEQLHQLILVDSLNISGRMNIKTLEPAAMLSLLRVFYASSTGISDITPLKNLIKLEVILISNTGVASLQPLSRMANIKMIMIENTSVADLSPLYGMSKLQFVYADNTKVDLKEANRFFDKNQQCQLIFQTFDNTNWWKNLSKPWQDVFLSSIGIKTSPDRLQLQKIVNLSELTVTENFQINDLTPVQKLSRIKTLTFTGTSVNNLAPLSQVSGLVSLNCGKNPITDLTPVVSLTTLKSLDFSNSQVEELMPLQTMTWLETLKFSGTPVKKLKYITGLTALKVLEFYNTRISSLDEIEGLRNLESLKIFNTKISQKRVEKFKLTHPKCEVVFY